MPEVSAFKSVPARVSEVVVAAVPAPFCNRMKAGQFAGSRVYDSPQDCAITFQIVLEVFIVAVFFNKAEIFYRGIQIFEVVFCVFETVGIFKCNIGKEFWDLGRSGFECAVQAIVAYVEVDPFDIVTFWLLHVSAEDKTYAQTGDNCGKLFHFVSM